MRRICPHICQNMSELPIGATAIAAGLTILAAALLWPGMPGVTGSALVILGATSATVQRFHGTRTFLPIMLVHLATYGSLYALFVGASLHAAAQTGPVLSNHTVVDLVLSIGPLAIAL